VDLVLIAGVGVLALAAGALIVFGRANARVRALEAERRGWFEQILDRTKGAEEERRAMALALSSMDEGIVLFGPDGRTRFANPAADRHLGSRPGTIDAVLPLPLHAALVTASTRGEVTVVEAEIGEPSRWLRGAASRVEEDGSVLLVVSDVTEARRTEAIRRDFVANASHELKTPAASIRAAAETIASAARDDPAVVARFAGRLEHEAIRLSRIVSDLLDLSRLESGSELGGSVALDAIVRDEVERFAGPAAESGLELSVRAEAVPGVRGSARDLALMVRNLIDNAIRYTASGGRVDVEVGADGEDVLVSVRDTGVGIPTRDLPRVFERFYRVDRARSRETGGTGLGLSIVKHVVENHAGRVTVDSELGRGTRFEIRLPAARAEDPSSATDIRG
jgi:two-component system sensor histidine kinase SenX3